MFKLSTSSGKEVRRGSWHSMRNVLCEALCIGCRLERWNGSRWETDSSAFVAAKVLRS
jgi:hypothetical protein